ncbi:hypothetical protein LOTGIDRAFT_174665 [Lottia gigantea]|uniref:Uncharacterized protein n=1 Tax=Lottia gigantea TaxID=225164 RepID=V3ZZS7_LOTGI|nr:hypothetical protein LOTGIDRAFT_174665 [Lottia gigantea]ESO97058.1 hypothetical protein LOTGIDRAFT_174665 [Lottia gigantea]
MFCRPKNTSSCNANNDSDETSSDSFQESTDSDDSLRDPHFTPTKHDLRKADLSTDDDDQILQHFRKIKRTNTNAYLTPFANVIANQNVVDVNNISQKTNSPLDIPDTIAQENTVTENNQNKDLLRENTVHSIQIPILDPVDTLASVDSGDDTVVENHILDHEEVVVTKTRAKRGRANTENWDRNINKRLRMEGKVYKSPNSNIRHPRKIQPRKCTKACEADKRKQCNNISEDDRQQMFLSFWNMTWSEKKVLISNLVERQDVQDRTTISPASSRRNYTYNYYLRKDGARIYVCKNLFLTTLNIGEKTLYNWVNTTTKTAKVPCTKRSRKGENNNPIMNRTSFKNIFDEMNLSLFKPRKDQCDLCCSYEVGNVDEEQYNQHIQRKNAARSEKATDKEAAISDDSLAVITVDVQAVLLCPSLQARCPLLQDEACCTQFYGI